MVTCSQKIQMKIAKIQSANYVKMENNYEFRLFETTECKRKLN